MTVNLFFKKIMTVHGHVREKKAIALVFTTKEIRPPGRYTAFRVFRRQMCKRSWSIPEKYTVRQQEAPGPTRSGPGHRYDHLCSPQAQKINFRNPPPPKIKTGVK